MTLLFLFILGIAIGSFLNVLIDRLPNDKSIGGRSYCDHCKKKLNELDLIPLISFFWLGGKCRNCGKKISWFYPGVEFLTGLTFILVFLYAPSATLIGRFLYIGLFSCLIAIFFADLKYQLIPNELLIAMFIFALAIIGIQNPNLQFILHRIFEGLLVALPLALLYFLTKGRAIGFADSKLGFVFGFLLGLIPALIAAYLGFVIGAIIGLILVLSKRKKMKSTIAFGPFLALGLVIVLFWQQPLVTFFQFYLGF